MTAPGGLFPQAWRVEAVEDPLAAASLWRRLEAEVGGGRLTSSWDWVETWVRHYGDRVPHAFLVGRRNGAPAAAALLTRGDFPRRWIGRTFTRHLGTAGEPDAESVFVEYNRPLCAPEDLPGFAAALLSFLREDPAWDEIRLDGFDPEAARPFLEAAPGFTVRERPCPAVDLRPARGSPEAALALLRSETRARIRRSLRGFGTVTAEWAETADQARDILEELIVLHQKRWTKAGHPGVFASPRFTAFHRELVSRLLPQGRAVLFRARAASGTVGCLYSLIDNGRLLFYQSGLAAFDDNKLKPGLVVHALCLQECARRGLEEYDFMAGDNRYKSELANVERRLVWAALRRPGRAFRLLGFFRRMRGGA